MQKAEYGKVWEGKKRETYKFIGIDFAAVVLVNLLEDLLGGLFEGNRFCEVGLYHRGTEAKEGS